MARGSGYQPEELMAVVDRLNREYFIPDLQRPYEWDEEQIIKLFDSIMRGYPINTFLIWAVNKSHLDANGFSRYNFVESNKQVAELQTRPLESEYCYFVLDGQQRLTSLNIGINGYLLKRKKRHRLYFNVLSGQTRDSEGLLYEFEFRPEGADKLIESEEKYWVRVSWLLSKLRDRISTEIARELTSPEYEKQYDTISDNLARMDKFLVEGTIYYYEEKEQDENRVLDIFIRTNSGGTKLGYSDLLFSKIKVKWRGTRDARIVFKKLTEDINGDKYEFNNDFVLKTALVCLAENSEQVRFNLANFSDEKVQSIERNWEKLERAIRTMRDLIYNPLQLNHDKLIPSYSALIPLVAYAYVNELPTFQRREIMGANQNYDEIREYLYKTLLTGTFSSQTDTTLWNVQEIILNNKGEVFPTKTIFNKLREARKTLDIQEEALNKISYGSRNSHLFMHLIYNSLKLDFKADANQPQQDHIFCQAELEKAGYDEEAVNDIGNIRCVIKDENLRKLATPYEEWIKTVSEEERKIHLIPDGQWSTKDYPNFLDVRKKAILTKINRSD